jgi:hypothetical protein
MLAMSEQPAANKTENGGEHEKLHHRSHDILSEYWEKLRGSNQLPQETLIEPSEIASIWDHCFLISLDDVTRRVGYRYSYLGEALISAFGDSSASPDLALQLLSSSRVPSAQKMDEAIATKRPVIDNGNFVNTHHMNIRYRTCIAPFGHEDGQVSHLFGVMRWKAY